MGSDSVKLLDWWVGVVERWYLLHGNSHQAADAGHPGTFRLVPSAAHHIHYFSFI
jgi:hypothetical protein